MSERKTIQAAPGEGRVHALRQLNTVPFIQVPDAVFAFDPGSASGAMAVVAPDAGCISASPLPIIEEYKRVDTCAVLDWVDNLGIQLADRLGKSVVEPDNPLRCAVVIENVHSMPKQGVASTFRFGRAAGALEGALMACNVPVFLIEPVAWKRYFELLKRDKNASIEVAKDVFGVDVSRGLKKNHGLAEAALMAQYGFTTIRMMAELLERQSDEHQTPH